MAEPSISLCVVWVEGEYYVKQFANNLSRLPTEPKESHSI